MSLVYLCFSSGVYLYFRILMYVKRHEQFGIGCGAILNQMYYYYEVRLVYRPMDQLTCLLLYRVRRRAYAPDLYWGT